MKVTKTDRIVKFPKLRGSLGRIMYPAIAETKFDGETQYCYIKDNSSYLINSHGLIREQSSINLALESYFQDLECVLVGELYCNDGKNNELYTLNGNKRNDSMLKFVIYDIISIGKENIQQAPLIKRKELIKSLFIDFKSDCVSIIPYAILNDCEEVDLFFKDKSTQGYEGVVIKNMNERFYPAQSNWTKIKTSDTNLYPVSFIDPLLERIEVFVKTYAGERPVGVKVTTRQKESLKVGELVEIEHRGILSQGGLRNPVYKEKG